MKETEFGHWKRRVQQHEEELLQNKVNAKIDKDLLNVTLLTHGESLEQLQLDVEDHEQEIENAREARDEMESVFRAEFETRGHQIDDLTEQVQQEAINVLKQEKKQRQETEAVFAQNVNKQRGDLEMLVVKVDKQVENASEIQDGLVVVQKDIQQCQEIRLQDAKTLEEEIESRNIQFVQLVDQVQHKFEEINQKMKLRQAMF
jgi:hypothetical protein